MAIADRGASIPSHRCVGLSAINGAAISGAGRIIAVDRLKSKRDLDELISARLKLSEINAGMDALKTGEVARQVIAF